MIYMKVLLIGINNVTLDGGAKNTIFIVLMVSGFTQKEALREVLFLLSYTEMFCRKLSFSLSEKSCRGSLDDSKTSMW